MTKSFGNLENKVESWVKEISLVKNFMIWKILLKWKLVVRKDIFIWNRNELESEMMEKRKIQSLLKDNFYE